MRTVKRKSVELNGGKWRAVERLAAEFACDKQRQLEHYQEGMNFAAADGWRERRDDLKLSDYHRRIALPVHMSDLAVKDAFETEEKYWAAIAKEIDVSGREWNTAQKGYGRWLLSEPQRFSQLILGHAPISEQFELRVSERKQVQNYLRRRARKLIGRRPQVRLARSFVLDETLYRVFETETGEWVAISCLARGQRLVIPLKGRGEIKGNLRVVLVPEKRSVELHLPFEVKARKAAGEEVVALDVGVTEVFADDAGNIYGEGMGAALKEASGALNEKGKKRNKLQALEKKYRRQGKAAKAHKLGRYNLGRKKQKARQQRIRARIANEVNRSFNQVIEERKPAVIVVEKLNLRGPAQSKELSRRVSYWHRRTLKERIEFKASAAGCRREQVNPAYSSQTCPACGYLSKANRKGDRFQCVKCGHAGHADVIAAINQKTRVNDPMITLYTPKEIVRKILVERYESRLEHRNAPSQDGKIRTVTVPGPTLERGGAP